MDHRVGVSSLLVVLFSRVSLRTLPFTLLFTIILFFIVWVIFCIFFFLDSDSYFFFHFHFFSSLFTFLHLISFSCFLGQFFALQFSWPGFSPFHMAIEDYLVGGFGCLLR